MQDLSEITVMLGALELGIIPPKRNVDQALAQMSKEDQRITKRKFRKLIRKHRSQTVICKPLSKADKRWVAAIECQRAGRKILKNGV